MSGWQAIETAPRDGTVILGLFRDFGRYTYALLHWRVSRDGTEEGWFNGDELELVDPVHWHRLPDEPAAPQVSS